MRSGRIAFVTVGVPVNRRGGKAMKGRIFTGLFLCSLFIVVAGVAQDPDLGEKPVWTLEFIKVTPENFSSAMGYLDDHWMRVRAEAKRQGVVLDYHRIQNAVLETPGHRTGDPSSVVLITKYKNLAAFAESKKLFASMRERRLFFDTPGVIRAQPQEDLFEAVNTQVFVEEGDTATGFKLLTKR
jgi:hypothetical protein